MKRALLYVCLFAISGIPAAAQRYSRRILAKSGDTIAGKTLTNVGQPNLNGKAEVVFIAFAPGLVGVFTPDRLVAQTGERIGRATLTGIAGPPAVSDKGRILFNATTDRGTGVYSASAVIAESGDRIDGKILTNVGPVQMAEAGDLVFLSEFNGGPQRPRRRSLRPLRRSRTSGGRSALRRGDAGAREAGSFRRAGAQRRTP